MGAPGTFDIGLSESPHVQPLKLTTEDQQRAVHTVLRHAHNPADARRLLEVLGLLEAAEQMREAA